MCVWFYVFVCSTHIHRYIYYTYIYIYTQCTCKFTLYYFWPLSSHSKVFEVLTEIPISLQRHFAMLHAKFRLWRMYHLPSVVGKTQIQDVTSSTNWMPNIWVCLKEGKNTKISHVWSLFSPSFARLLKMVGLNSMFRYHSQISSCWLDTVPPCNPLYYIYIYNPILSPFMCILSVSYPSRMVGLTHGTLW